MIDRLGRKMARCYLVLLTISVSGPHYFLFWISVPHYEVCGHQEIVTEIAGLFICYCQILM